MFVRAWVHARACVGVRACVHACMHVSVPLSVRGKDIILQIQLPALKKSLIFCPFKSMK